MANRDPLLAPVEAYYTARLESHGPTPAGVDWNSAESQLLRFDQLARLWRTERRFSVIDYGCGYGELARYLVAEGEIEAAYTGYDISERMVEAAVAFAGDLANCRFTNDAASLERSDYTIASGIFNVKLDAEGAAWEGYVEKTIAELARLSRRGFGFNVLTAYADADRRRPDLFYGDPPALFDHCMRTYSREVSLLHDYGLFEFTILVRLDGLPPATSS